MTGKTARGKKARPAKKLSLKRETVKDLGAGKELGDDQLGNVAGGMAVVKTRQCYMPASVNCPINLCPGPTRPSCVAPTQPPTECKV